MKREDWLDRLWETIEARRAMPFQWGASTEAHDCCTFVAACLDAMTDGGYVQKLLACYHDEESAKTYIANSGGLAVAISQHLESKRLSFMGRGDVALVLERGIELVGICIGDQIVSAGVRGLVFNPRAFAIAAWGS